MKSFHDYHLTGYEVDGRAREIRFHLAWLYAAEAEPRPNEDVIFTGVEDYFFEHDLGVNIVYAIQEVPLLEFLRTNEQQFQENAKWGRPRFWSGEVIQTLEQLSAKGARSFELSSSYGLSGWVVAAAVSAAMSDRADG
jgi:hypothetical protein